MLLLVEPELNAVALISFDFTSINKWRLRQRLTYGNTIGKLYIRASLPTVDDCIFSVCFWRRLTSWPNLPPPKYGQWFPHWSNPTTRDYIEDYIWQILFQSCQVRNNIVPWFPPSSIWGWSPDPSVLAKQNLADLLNFSTTYNLNSQKCTSLLLVTVVTKTKKFSLLSSQLRSAKFVFSKMANIIIDTLVSILTSTIGRFSRHWN